MTYVKAIEYVVENFGAEMSAEVVEKLEALKASVAKKNGAKSGKPTKTQVENEGIKAQILEVAVEPMTATAIGEAVGIPCQKASALLKQMIEAGTVEKTVEKRVSYFKAV